MGFSGLIFAAIVVVWLAYLVPWFSLRAHVGRADFNGPDYGDADQFAGIGEISDDLTLVRRSADWDLNDPELDVSTPFTRKAAVRDVTRIARIATFRRRRLLVGLSLVTVLVAVLTPFTSLKWWAVGVPLTLLVVSLGLCRFSVRSLDKALERRLAAIRGQWENQTITLAVPAQLTDERQHNPLETPEMSIELTAPVATMQGSLWDPIPVIQPSYVTRPLVPRTVRTIDLSAPTPPLAVPPTAEQIDGDAPAADTVADQLPRVVGE